MWMATTTGLLLLPNRAFVHHTSAHSSTNFCSFLINLRIHCRCHSRTMSSLCPYFLGLVAITRRMLHALDCAIANVLV